MVVYLVINTSFNDRDKERFGINFFLRKHKVVVLDVQDYTNPELYHIDKPTYEIHPNLNVLSCCSFKEVKSSVERFGAGVALISLSENYKDIKIKRFLQHNDIKVGILHGGMIPSVSINQNVISKMFRKFKSLSIKRFIKLLIHKLYSKKFDIKYYDFLITSNYETSLINYRFPKPLKVIESHCLDYDLVIKNKNSENIIDFKYVVFLDQYLLEHPDFLRGNLDLNVSADKYYEELNSFFIKIEKTYQYKVIIAAHPRADIKEYKKLFQGRDIICGKSSLLVKYSEFVLTHYSTAINFAVIYKKPIVFITNEDLETTDLKYYIREFSSLLDQLYINISSSNDLPSTVNINQDKYKEYKKKYIKNNKIDMLSYEIFYDTYIKSLLNGR